MNGKIVALIALITAGIVTLTSYIIIFIRERKKNISFNKKVNDMAKKKKDDDWDYTTAEVTIDLKKGENK